MSREKTQERIPVRKLEAKWWKRPIKKKLILCTFITIVNLSFLSLLIFILTSCNDDNGGRSHGKIIKNAVKDADGNKYDAVQIGDQVWMAENLKTTKYDNGTSIPLGNSGSKGGGHRYFPDGKSDNVNKYGYLYDWNAVMNGEPSSNANPSGVQGLCPKGWHMPSRAEFQNLIDYVSGQIATEKLGNTSVAKALASKSGWTFPYNVSGDIPLCNPSTNNSSGFSALPAGFYFEGVYSLGGSAMFWSSSNSCLNDEYCVEPNYMIISAIAPVVEVNSTDPSLGLSVRCIRD